ncbi:MAG: hypothetical protein ACXW4B_03645 [Micavibrio sp.]
MSNKGRIISNKQIWSMGIGSALWSMLIYILLVTLNYFYPAHPCTKDAKVRSFIGLVAPPCITVPSIQDEIDFWNNVNIN